MILVESIASAVAAAYAIALEEAQSRQGSVVSCDYCQTHQQFDLSRNCRNCGAALRPSNNHEMDACVGQKVRRAMR